KVLILSDCLSAINSLEMKQGDLVSEEIIGCKNALNSSACSITIGWIRGHDDNTGNEFAESLAKDRARRGTPVS
ncbi:Hypothetical protein FKW44_015752, partial [Caligus rogercresseyi]